MKPETLKKLQGEYVSRLVDGMDLDSLLDYVYEHIMDEVLTRSEAQLLAEINEYDPELLDNYKGEAK